MQQPGLSLEDSCAALHAQPWCGVYVQPEEEPEELIAARAKLDSVTLAQQEVAIGNAKQTSAPSSQQENQPAGVHICSFLVKAKTRHINAHLVEAMRGHDCFNGQ